MKNKNIGLIILVLLALCASGMLGWYIGKQQVLKEEEDNTPKVTENEKKEEEETPVPEVKPVAVDFNKVSVNEDLNYLVQVFLYGYVGDNSETIILESRRNNTNILDAKTKLKMAWAFGSKEIDKSKVYYEATPDGEGATGSLGIDFTAFKEYYKTIFGEELPSNTDYSVLGYDKDSLKNNVLYGVMATGGLEPLIAFKAVSLTQTGNVYELKTDAIYFEDALDNEKSAAYLEASNITYPESSILYHVTFTYEKVNNVNVLKSIVAY